MKLFAQITAKFLFLNAKFLPFYAFSMIRKTIDNQLLIPFHGSQRKPLQLFSAISHFHPNIVQQPPDVFQCWKISLQL